MTAVWKNYSEIIGRYEVERDYINRLVDSGKYDTEKPFWGTQGVKVTAKPAHRTHQGSAQREGEIRKGSLRGNLKRGGETTDAVGDSSPLLWFPLRTAPRGGEPPLAYPSGYIFAEPPKLRDTRR